MIIHIGIIGGQSPIVTEMARALIREEETIRPIARRLYRFIWNERSSHRDLLKGLHGIAQHTVAEHAPSHLVVVLDPVNFEKPYTEELERVSTVMKCTLPSFRTEKVDNAVWIWVKTLITEPEQMVEMLQTQQKEREHAVAPLRDRLATIETLLSEHKQQMERLLELHLGGEFPREILVERKEQLEHTIAALERSREEVTKQIDEQTITDDQMQGMERFASEVRSGLKKAEKDFQKRRHLIELLDVRGVLAIEEDQKVIYLSSQILDTEEEVILDIPNHFS